ncbi:MAG: hypothetical protein JXM71_03790 [Spirochaetales bacterium]|nr:hypothetical protein [Spirochaetales bacterium]
MKKLLIATMALAMTGAVWAQELEEPASAEEALALIAGHAERLKLTLEDSKAAEQALLAMVQAGIRVQNAFRLINDALDGGLREKELTQLAEQVRFRDRQGQSADQCETAAMTMVREQVRTKAATGTATQTKTQTQTRVQTPTAPDASAPVGAMEQGGKGK